MQERRIQAQDVAQIRCCLPNVDAGLSPLTLSLVEAGQDEVDCPFKFAAQHL
jgi:hypothetical protein